MLAKIYSQFSAAHKLLCFSAILKIGCEINERRRRLRYDTFNFSFPRLVFLLECELWEEISKETNVNDPHKAPLAVVNIYQLPSQNSQAWRSHRSVFLFLHLIPHRHIINFHRFSVYMRRCLCLFDHHLRSQSIHKY